jgi:hypothetical protein
MRFLRLPICWAFAFFAAGIPFWRIAYDQLNLSFHVFLPGALLLGVLTMMLVALESARARSIIFAMLMCVPMVDIVTIVRDTAVDPTTHNLAPFELAIAGVLGACFVVPGLVAGLIVRALLRRQA